PLRPAPLLSTPPLHDALPISGGDFHGCADQFTAFKEHNDENPASHPHRSSHLSRRHRTSGAERLLGHGLGLGRFRVRELGIPVRDRKSTRLNSSHVSISYAVF